MTQGRIDNPRNLSSDPDDAPEGDNWPVGILTSFQDKIQDFRTDTERYGMMDIDLHGLLETLEKAINERIEGFTDANRH